MVTQGQNEFDLRGKTVLELGAGVGLPGLTAAMLGASRVLLTDIEPLLPGLSRKVEANGMGNVVEVGKLVWGSDESLASLDEFDLVLMSDVFFDREEMESLGKTLKKACGEKTRVWASTEIRPWTGDCLSVLADMGFGVFELQSPLGPCRSSTAKADECSGPFVAFCLMPVSPNEAGRAPATFYSC
ncbi:hypothetical protein L6164_019711 [Bauhinia variegata]|uniref:Uncharacterized protein n=1 Tax=Bauhinia variegata TaxID=167791 RepID=A0ACB9MSN4_BAUVA|nr:hypothetical protein L6164_019711 [Bauhinia variegata]